MKKIYVVTWSTESSDSGIIGYFLKKPSDRHLTALFKELMPDEFIFDDEDGDHRLVFWEVEALTEMSLPKPVKAVPSI